MGFGYGLSGVGRSAQTSNRIRASNAGTRVNTSLSQQSLSFPYFEIMHTKELEQ